MSETYCRACGDHAPTILGRCASCWGDRPLETALADMVLLAREAEEARDADEEIARLARELEEARERLKQYQRLVVFADSVARARGDACGLCDALGRDDQPYQSHRAADLIAEAERALIARRGKGGGE